MGDFREIAEISAIFVVRINFKLLECGRGIYNFNYLTQGFQIYYLFREIFKFRNFMDTNIFPKNHKSVHNIAKFNYLARVTAFRNLRILYFKDIYIVSSCFKRLKFFELQNIALR